MIHKHIAMISVHECPLASSEGKERGGINVYVFELSKALSKLGWSVDIYTRTQDDTNPRIVQVSKSLRVIHVSCGPHTPLSKKEILSHIDEFTNNVLTFIQNEHITYDVMHAHYYLSGIVAHALSKSLSGKTPWVMTFHTLGLMKQLVNHSAPFEDPDDRVSLEKSLAQEASAIITTSENDSSYVSALYDAPKDRVHTIPPGVDTHLFFPKSKDEAKKNIGAESDHHIILAVGRIDPVKGFDVLLYAMKILLSKQPQLANHACLWIVGGDVGEDQAKWSTELTKLKHLQNELSLSTTVRFIPALPQEKLVNYYNAADVVVMPSHYESFGMVALEALACDRPVITTDVMGISPILKEFPKGHVISANNPVLLADLLQHVLTQPHGYYIDKKAMHKFDWETVAIHITAVYEKVLK
ncbi:glycosyltransferase [Candidatus Woesebacteria bacterium]|jgi:D-inositol-3-phosphate glycosyltransferase|nr:glycosyltransferase [Candidatus Woesebacteria bacterium]